MKHFFSVLSLLIACLPLWGQMQEPVKFSVQQKVLSPSEIELIFEAEIDEGWHVYSTNLPEGGPTSATLTFDVAKGVKAVGALKPAGTVLNKFDEMFGMEVSYMEGTAVFVQRLELTESTYEVTGYLQYGACNDENCLPPTNVEFTFTGSGTPKAAAKPAAAPAPKAEKAPAPKADKAVEKKAEAAPAPVVEAPAATEPAAPVATAVDTAQVVAAAPAVGGTAAYWTPVVDELAAFGGDAGTSSDMAWWAIFGLGFLGGLVALFTPCVWPIIPMTVSFFLKRSKDKKKGITDAITYGISIVVIYVVLGLVVTGLFGASALNALSTNAVFNLLFCAMLLVFGASFLGAFELTLPASWSNAVDSKAEKTTGLLSIFLMAFTLSLVSFSCTGPIIGFLLVEVSTTGSLLAPTIGMLGFALALALPFTLFALFPTMLKSAPRSGGWMNCVKVCLGFVELAFALKFLSVADLAYGWGILDREVFLVLWIMLFFLLGLYLLGLIHFPHDDEDEPVGRVSVPRFFLALISMAFALYMVPGLWGAPLKAVSAFSPPMQTQDFNLYENEVHARYTDFDEGMAAARREGKPVMLDFTGYGCVNCRKMELAVWTDPQVASHLNADYVLITLFVDEKTPLPEVIEVTEQGTTRKLRTVGDKWSYLQRSKFGANAQPFYVLLDNEGKPLNKPYSYDEDIAHYVEFLRTGLDNYRR